MKFKDNFIKLIRGKAIVIHCNTKKKADMLLNELEKFNISWRSGISLKNENHWMKYMQDTCYLITTFSLEFEKLSFYADKGYRIIEFDELIEFDQDKIKVFSNLMDNYISEEFKKWLIENGFFKAPASVNHHGTYIGALFDHSYIVTKALLSFTKRLDLNWENERSPYIVGMFHDLCKIDNYTIVKGKWQYNDATLLPGHGEKSIILLQKHMQLTDEELFCIRWHMGAFDEREKWKYYSEAIEKYPNVLYTHTADMVAAKILKV